MLTPAKTDPNRKEELDRRKENPTAFGTAELSATPKDWASSDLKRAADDVGGEVVEDKEPTEKKPAAPQKQNQGSKK